MMSWPFENNTRGITQKIVSARLKHEKLKKRIAVAAIALATMLMCSVLLLVTGIMNVNQNGGNQITGSFHALYSKISQEEYEHLSADSKVEKAGFSASLGTSRAGEGRLNIAYSSFESLEMNGLQVTEGSMPEQENEILIEKDYLKFLGLTAGVGDTIQIMMPDAQEETSFVISGYLSTSASGTDRTLYAAIVSERYFNAHDGWQTLAVSAMIRLREPGAKAEIENTIAEITKAAGIEKPPFLNETYINVSNPSVLMIGVAAAGLAMIGAAGILVIYCIFYIAIVNSIHEYGQLRTIGMTGRQIRRMVYREGWALCVAAIPIGLAAGSVLSYLLLPQGFQFAALLWAWPLVTVLVVFTVRLSVRKPARLAAAVSPIDAYRYSGSEALKQSKSKKTGSISPVMLAKKHIVRDKKKNILTITSMLLTGILLFGLSSVLTSMNAREMSLSGFPRGQFVIDISFDLLRNHSLDEIQPVNPFTEEVIAKLHEVTGVEKVTEYHHLPAAKDLDATGSEVVFVGFDREDMELLQSCSPEQRLDDYDRLAEQNKIIIGRPDSFEESFGFRAQAGQILTFKIFDGATAKTMDFEIAAVLDEKKMGDNGDKIDRLMLPVDAMNRIASGNTISQCAVRVSDSAVSQAENEITQIMKNAPELDVRTLSAAIVQNENFIQGMKLTLMVVVVSIGCFAVMNFVNTMLTGIITRRKEFALMRSVGMTQKQLITMIQCESLMTVIAGLLLSIFVGGGIGYSLCSYLKYDFMSYLQYRFPLGIAVVYCAIVIVCTIIITNTALRQQNKLSLMEQLGKATSG